MIQVALIPGDGIGPEVTAQAVRIIRRIGMLTRLSFEFVEVKAGGAAIDEFGEPLPRQTLESAMRSDVVLLGAVGGPRWDALPYELRPEQALLGLRKSLELYANIRPALMFKALVNASSLKKEFVENIDLIVVRELTGGIYFGKPSGIFEENNVRYGVNTMTYSEYEVERIARKAFDIARRRKKKVTSVDKANILHTSILWRDVVERVHRKEYDDVVLEHMYVDNAAMQLIRNPKQFDVILTENMFGDILSDEASMLTGSIGMLPSASLGNKYALYEPVHGSAPDIAGKGIANPIASILSAGMIFEHSFNKGEWSKRVFSAVELALNEGYRTADIASPGTTIVSTEKMGELIEGFLSN
ncbi:MAG: 3-isopropylmalate dehydrogenase [Candidatus Kryptoniota bacterium]